jgi:hypothetical protein
MCKCCDYTTSRGNDYNKHLLTPKHLKNENDNKMVEKRETKKSQQGFYCKLCHQSCINKYKMDKHKLTAKHLKNEKFCLATTQIICPCGKEYKFASGLARHKLTCLNGGGGINPNTILELVKNNNEILKDNKEFKELLVDQNKHLITIASAEKTTIINNHNTTQNTQNNTQNNMTFNLNNFLNEKCKDAINMVDFIASLKVSFEDLENTGKNGFVKSLSQCITRELGKLDVYSRPIHCSDTARKVLHIKNENEWQKDTDEHTATKKMLSKINHTMNFSQILKWKDTYPSCELSNDKRNTLFLKIVRNMVEGEDETYDKVIKNISDKIAIDKGSLKNMMLAN